MARPPEIQAIFEAFEDGGPYQSIEDANRALTALTGAYNRRPQAALGEVSPDIVAQLLYGDWESRGALRLNQELSDRELGGAPFLADARTLMTYVRDHSPVKQTSAGNLPRAAVAGLLPKLCMPLGDDPPGTVEEARPLNERDVPWLELLRAVLTFARLVVRRNGFRLTAKGGALLPSDRAGELYALLFRSFFRELDLRGLDWVGRHKGLQATIAYSFYKVRDSSGEWVSPEALVQRAWLARAQDPPSEYELARGEDFRDAVFEHRVLKPLTQFGLLEERVLPGEDRWDAPKEYRRTALFDRFIRFEFRR